MSFFGFDPSGPPQQQQRPGAQESYDFQDTYEGLGEIGDENDDAMNDETFGISNVGKNFDFAGAVPAVAPSSIRPELSFAKAAAANDDDFMKDLWGDSTPEPKTQSGAHGGVQGQNPATAQEPSGSRKVLSLEEIEAQLTAIDHSQQRSMPLAPPMQQQFYPGMPPQYGGYMMPQGYMMPPPQYGMPYPGQFMPPHPMGQQVPGMPPMHPNQAPQLFMQGGAPVQNAQQAPQGPLQGSVPQQVGPQDQQQQQPQQQQQLQAQQPQQNQQQFASAAAAGGNQAVGTQSQPPVSDINAQNPLAQKAVTQSPADMSQFPVLGAAQQQHDQGQHGQDQLKTPDSAYSGYGRHHHPQEDLLPEEQQRLARRQEKVSRIMRYCGVMNPKDKDFVTRFQLSQIVTDDPYNEDFYAQVYRVIHPKSAPDGSVVPVSQPNSIAQAYLDQSGHRLGGRFKRADVALHRMQQQVQKAVTVAKERQKLPQNVREGVLGKVSVGSGKKPRQQLVILSKAAQKAKDIEDSEDIPAKKGRSPSIAAPSKPIKKYTKKDIMSILEDIISNLMTVESESRLTNDVDTTKLWESLHVLDQKLSSGDDESFVNPFIQALNYSKALKILPRLFKFLTREQILTVVTLIMANMENLKVIKDGSYTTYADKKVPEPITKLVDVYTLTFCKVLMNAVQEFKFTEIVGLLLILIQHNVLSFVSTTKIGLSVVTSLLSRAELMTGEGHISATDLSAWTSCYDELFTALESRIAAIFSPHQADTEDDYVWQFLATLSLGGKLSHQRIIVDEVRDEIFGVMNRAKALDCSVPANVYKKQNMLNNLNMYLVVMGLVADENEIQELKS